MPLKQGLGYAGKAHKVFVFVGMLILSVNCSFAQALDSIYYFVPSSVKAKILDYKKKDTSGYPFYGILSHYNDTTTVLISRYGDSPKEFAYLIKNSNRFIKLNPTETIPILLGVDLVFSNLLHSVKNEGDPYAVFKHKLINASGYLIEYQGLYDKIRIIKAEYHQY
jgi:hypothetical protein